MKNSLLIFAIICLSLSLNINSIGNDAGSGKISGTIKDAITGGPLIGAAISIEGTSLGAASNLDGEFVIPNIQSGTYTLLVRYLGYEDIDIENLVIEPGKTRKLDIDMVPMSTNLEEIVVTVQARGQMAAINQQRASNVIVDVVSSDHIKEVPDATAAESIGRLPGVALQRSGGEGNKIVVRGLSPQFSIIEVDGVRLSGTDGNRSVGLSTLSTDILDGIELTKSLTPDKDADAIGGVVNLRTRVAQQGFHFNINTYGTYSSMEQNFDNYKVTANIGNRFFNNKVGVLLDVGTEKIARSADKFIGSYNKDPNNTYPFLTYGATITETKTFRHRQNGSFVLDFKNDFMNVKFKNSYSQRKDDTEERVNNFNFNSNRFILDAATIDPIERIQSHLLSSEFRFLNTQLDVNLSYSRSNRERDKDVYRIEDYNILGETTIMEAEMNFAQPEDLINKYFHPDSMSIDQTVLTRNTREYLERDDITRALKVDWKVPFRLGNAVSGNIKVGVKYSRKERSSNTNVKETPFRNATGIAMVAAFYEEFPHFLTPEDLGFFENYGIAGKNFEDPDYDYGEVLDGLYRLSWSPDLALCKEYFNAMYVDNEGSGDWLKTNGLDSYRDDFTNVEELMAGYAMAEINITRKLMVLPGVRFERMHSEYTGNYILQDPNPTGVAPGYPIPVSVPGDSVPGRDNQYFFPSINIKYELNDIITLRGAAFRSSARPDYSLLSPLMIADANRLNLTSYNPYLKPALANNFDLGVSFYNNKLGMFNVNIYYKEISGLISRLSSYRLSYFDEMIDAPESLIESLRAPQVLYDDALYGDATKNSNVPINNPEKASFKGIELSWQTNFWYLPGLWRGLVLDVNYSYVKSKAKLPYIGFETAIDTLFGVPVERDVPAYKTEERSLLSQPDHTVNVRVGWDYKGFSSRVSFRYEAGTQTGVDELHHLMDAFFRPTYRFDLFLKQDITERLTCTFDFANMNSYMQYKYIENIGGEFERDLQYYGYTLQLGLKYAF